MTLQAQSASATQGAACRATPAMACAQPGEHDFAGLAIESNRTGARQRPWHRTRAQRHQQTPGVVADGCLRRFVRLSEAERARVRGPRRVRPSASASSRGWAPRRGT